MQNKLIKYCIDCSKIIHFTSIRCKDCYHETQRIGTELPKCLDCGKKLKDYRSKRCQSCAYKGNLNSSFGKFSKCKYYCTNCKKEIDKKGRSKRCHICMGLFQRGKNNPNFGQLASHGKGSYYQNIYMRSSWEIKFAQFLDLSNYKWKYESKTFDLGNATYTPDFYIPEWDLYIEIKGWWRDNAKKKFKLFKKLYPKENIKILVKKNLINLGIL